MLLKRLNDSEECTHNRWQASRNRSSNLCPDNKLD